MSKHLAQFLQNGILRLAVAHGAGQSLDGGAGEDILRFIAADAAALKVKQRLVVKLADRRAVVTDDVLLRAENQRDSLVHGVLAEHQHRLLLVADGVGRAVLEVDRAAEDLLRRVLQPRRRR